MITHPSLRSVNAFRFRNRHHQRGVAIITALLLTTLAITIVASLFWQQQVQVRSIENQRLQLQKEWILRGSLDWARLILREDGKITTADYLSEPWAAPLEATRLSQYAGDSTAEGDDAVLSGTIVDAQSRYNLVNLVKGGVVDPNEMKMFVRLLGILHVSAGLAPAIAQAMIPTALAAGSVIDPGSPVAPPPAAVLTQMPVLRIEDLLAIPGITPAIVNKLKDYVIVLPAATGVNINTASPEVLSARLDGMPISQVKALIANRENVYFRDSTDIATRVATIAPGATIDTTALSAASSFFLVNGKIRMGRAGLDTASLIERDRAGTNTTTKVIWSREL